MKLKKIIALLLSTSLLLMMSSSALADVNIGNDDGTDWKTGTSDNYWGVFTESGAHLQETEGLRITVYNADTETKVFNTIDISGNPNVSAVSDMNYFSDGTELIPKTTWLTSRYVGSTYNAADNSSKTKFNKIVEEKLAIGMYHVQYVSSLSNLTIISENNTDNLEKIKEAVGSENFLRNLCDLISGVNYSDFASGKYKIAFEPVAYFRYNGSNWALTATEVGILNTYLRNNGVTSYNVKALMGPLTHSNLPRSAFLVSKDLGIQKYSPTDSDYYNGDSRYNSDSCIIRCMGIGTIGNSGADDGEEELDDEGEDAAEYHTDTEVYTSWTFRNTGDTPILDIEGDNYVTTFNIRNNNGELPATGVVPSGNNYLVDFEMRPKYDDEGNVIGKTSEYTYAYDSEDVDKIERVSANSKVKVFIANTVGLNEYNEKVERYDEMGLDTRSISIPKPYVLLGSYSDGDTININKKYLDLDDSDSEDEEEEDYDSDSEEGFQYTVTTSSGSVITSGTITFACPADEEAMGWFKWKTPKAAQKITITITSLNSDVKIVDSDGNLRRKLIITAKTVKVEEVTPPDPQVTDTRLSWWKNYSTSSVQKSVSGYASKNGSSTLSWYTWSYSAGSNWTQNGYYTYNSSGEVSKKHFNVITAFRSGYFGRTYMEGFGSEYKKSYYYPYYYGVDNQEYSNGWATKLSGYTYSGAVIIELDFSGENNGMEKTEYTVSLEADVTVTPSNYCYTATYKNGKYTMKSGYGVQIAVTTNLTGDTGECTDAQQVNTMFSEFNYNKQTTAKYNRLLEKVGGVYVFKKNEYSTYKDRVHFTPIWYPDNTPYRIYTEVFDVWCPAGQLSVRIVDDSIKIKGNVYDDWHVAPVKP